MNLKGLSRRGAMLGGLGLAATTSIFADDQTSPVAHGVLAQNSLAQAFESAPSALPDVTIWGPDGKRSLDTLKGRTVLMPLWAEWCGPCMSEIPDFARLQQKYGNDKFAIIPILTGTQKQFTPQSLGQILPMMHAGVFEPLIEDNRGDLLLKKMARKDGEYNIPCNLLLAPDGHVVAREIGRLSNTDDADPAKSYKDVLIRTGERKIQSRWGQADGDAFAKAMADGFLT